jgi:hypothetical protein
MSYLEPIDTRTYGYDEWLRFAFDQPVAKDPWYYSEAMHFECDPSRVLEYYARLFREPAPIASFDDAHLEQGFWFVVGSQLSEWLWDDEIPIQLRVECIAAMPSIFQRLLADRPLDQACYMWWDMLRHFAGAGDPRIVDAMVAALEQILALPVRHIQMSALHGLGHLEHARKAEIIETFLKRNATPDPELQLYANAAIAGKIL